MDAPSAMFGSGMAAAAAAPSPPPPRSIVSAFSTLLRNTWNAWDARAMVLLSLVLQIYLFVFGNRRKRIVSNNISRMILCFAYQTKDWVAIAALGKLSNSDAESPTSNVLRALWAPLLILHLGGPDTITAYSFQDTQLWNRHLLTLVAQFFLALYESKIVLLGYALFSAIRPDVNDFQCHREFQPSFKEKMQAYLREAAKGGSSNQVKSTLQDYLAKILSIRMIINSLKQQGGRNDCNCGMSDDILQLSIKLDFDTRIIAWHLATSICYHQEFGDCHPNNAPNQSMKRSKYLSDYMMYLLVIRPDMLNSEYRKSLWLERAIDKLKDRRSKASNMRAFTKLLLPALSESSPETAVAHLPEFAGYLANTLNECHNKWELVEAMWIEILLYAPHSYQHVNHIRSNLGQYGREFLALIWIMAGNHILQVILEQL
ncbi:hypothetical protein SLEP1_g38560 [Rubroshorea leprosula]|nr:hypothetical protein SLEP1_g38560 [Rubroshorea leprosula]